MKRKYLDDIGITDRPDTIESTPVRIARWAAQREEYGFDERELWDMDYTWRLWLYEHLMAFKEHTDMDLDCQEFCYRGNTYTQRQLIDMMLERLKVYFDTNSYEPDKTQREYVAEIEDIWAVVFSAMWY